DFFLLVGSGIMRCSATLAMGFTPLPCTSDDLFELRMFRPPAQLLHKCSWTGAKHCRIAFAAWRVACFNLLAGGPRYSVAHLLHRVALASTDVVDVKAWMIQLLASQDVCFRNV